MKRDAESDGWRPLGRPQAGSIALADRASRHTARYINAGLLGIIILGFLLSLWRPRAVTGEI